MKTYRIEIEAENEEAVELVLADGRFDIEEVNDEADPLAVCRAISNWWRDIDPEANPGPDIEEVVVMARTALGE